MSYRKCPFANQECKFYDKPPVVAGEDNGCRSNEHHLYGRARAREIGKTAVEFASLERNRMQLCERQHGDIEALYGWLEFPCEQIMKAIIEADTRRSEVA